MAVGLWPLSSGGPSSLLAPLSALGLAASVLTARGALRYSLRFLWKDVADDCPSTDHCVSQGALSGGGRRCACP